MRISSRSLPARFIPQALPKNIGVRASSVGYLDKDEWRGLRNYDDRLRARHGSAQPMLDRLGAGRHAIYAEVFLDRCPDQAQILSAAATGSEGVMTFKAALRLEPGLLFHGASSWMDLASDQHVRPSSDDLGFTGGIAFTRVPHEFAIPFIKPKTSRPAIVVIDTAFFNQAIAQARAQIDLKKNYLLDDTPPEFQSVDGVTWHGYFMMHDPMPLNRARELWVWDDDFEAARRLPWPASLRLVSIPRKPTSAIQSLPQYEADRVGELPLFSHILKSDLLLQLPAFESSAKV